MLLGCREIRNALKEKIQELRAEHQARHDKYWDEHKAWLKQQQEERQIRQAFLFKPSYTEALCSLTSKAKHFRTGMQAAAVGEGESGARRCPQSCSC